MQRGAGGVVLGHPGQAVELVVGDDVAGRRCFAAAVSVRRYPPAIKLVSPGRLASRRTYEATPLNPAHRCWESPLSSSGRPCTNAWKDPSLLVRDWVNPE